MSISADVRRNALALAIVLTAANCAASCAILHEAHKLHDEAQAQCDRVMASSLRIIRLRAATPGALPVQPQS